MKKSLGGCSASESAYVGCYFFGGHLNTDISLGVWPKHVQLLGALKPDNNQTNQNHLLTFRAPAAHRANRSRLSP